MNAQEFGAQSFHDLPAEQATPVPAAKLQPVEQWDAETKAWVVRWVEVGQ